MNFEDVPIHSIKSISQRALLLLWDRLSRDCDFPSLEDFKPSSRMHDPKELVVWAIEQAGATRRFRALYQGEALTEIFDAAWQGKTMDEVAPGSPGILPSIRPTSVPTAVVRSIPSSRRRT